MLISLKKFDYYRTYKNLKDSYEREGKSFEDSSIRLAWDFVMNYKRRYTESLIESKNVICFGNKYLNKRLNLNFYIDYGNMGVLFDPDRTKIQLVHDIDDKLKLAESDNTRRTTGLVISSEGNVYLLCSDKSFSNGISKIYISETKMQFLRNTISLLDNYTRDKDTNYVSNITMDDEL